MKILFTVAGFHKQGAVSKYAAELSERFVKDHEVHVLTSWTDYEVPGLIVHKIPILKWPYYLQIGMNAIKNTVFAKRLDEKYKFDIIHSQGAESLYQDIIKAPSCHKAAVEKFKKERGLGYRLLKTLEPASNIVLAIERYNYTKKNFKRLIVLSQGTFKEMQDYYDVPSECMKLIPNGVNIEEFTLDNRGLYISDIRKTYGLDENDTVLLFVGWEFKRKGLKFIIDAMPMLKKDVKLLVVGGDNKNAYAKQASDLGVSDRIVFAGASKEVRKFYAASDLFVFPTEYESFSMATLEAVSSGLPILATKVNGTDELIKEGENGFFIQRDGKDIAAKVNYILDNGLVKRMSIKARESAIDHSWDNIANRTLELYREVA